MWKGESDAVVLRCDKSDADGRGTAAQRRTCKYKHQPNETKERKHPARVPHVCALLQFNTVFFCRS